MLVSGRVWVSLFCGYLFVEICSFHAVGHDGLLFLESRDVLISWMFFHDAENLFQNKNLSPFK